MVKGFASNDDDARGVTRLLRGIFWPHRRALLAAVCLSLIAAVANLAQPLIVGRIVDAVPEGAVWGLVALLLGVALVALVSRGLQHYLLARSAEAAVYDLRVRLGQKLVGLPMRVLDKERPGDLVSRLTSDTTLVRSAFTGGFADVFGGMVLLAGAALAMGFLDPLLLLIVLLVGGLAVLCVGFASVKIQRLTALGQTAVGSIGSLTHQALVSIRLIKSSRAESVVQDQLKYQADRARESGRRSAGIQSLLWPASDLAMQLAFLAVLGVGGVRVAQGYMTVPGLVTFIMFLFIMSAPLTRIFMALVTLRGAMGSLRRIHEVLEWEGEQSQTRVGSLPARGHELSACLERPAELSFRSVSFSYDAETCALEEVSFAVRRDELTALVGSSGSGKTTVLSLIERFYPVCSGEIALDGIPIDKISLQDWRRSVCYVDQEALVVGGTVRENLALGSGEVSDEACYGALRKVNLHNRFKSERGLDSILGSSGVNLSGGERQRLALARAFLTSAPVVLLDEPTSSVDSQNEELIRESIAALRSGRIVIMVAHRLSTVMAANRIVVLEGGEVRGVGDHGSLLADNAAYRELVLGQAEL